MGGICQYLSYAVTEVNFYHRHGGRRPKGSAAAGKGLRGSRFSAGASDQISLMKWIYAIQPNEPGATDILSYAP